MRVLRVVSVISMPYFTHQRKKVSMHLTITMEDFRVAIEKFELTDLSFTGHKFTWTNRQLGVCMGQVRLD